MDPAGCCASHICYEIEGKFSCYDFFFEQNLLYKFPSKRRNLQI